MTETSQTTRTVKITDIIGGDSPAVLTSERVSDARGRTRLFTQKVPVPDVALFTRLSAEVVKGDEVEVTVVTQWTDDDYTTSLADFRKVCDQCAEVTAPLISAAA